MPALHRLLLDPPTGLPTLGLLAHCPVVRRNLLKSSEDLTNAAWTKTNGGVGSAATVTAGATDPLGGATAFRVQFALNTGTTTSDSSTLSQSISGTFVNPHSVSHGVWLKSNTVSSYVVNFGDASTAGSTSNITVTPTWQLVSLSPSVFATTTIFAVRLRGGQTPTNSDSADILVWHPQANEGTALLDYEATSDNQRVINLVPGYNAIKYSEQLDNAAWTKTRSSVTANAVANPLDGALTADKLVEDATATSNHTATQVTTQLVNGNTYTYSAYAKAGERTWIQIGVNDSVGYFARASFNLGTGAVGTVNNGSAAISSVGNGWYRCSITGVSTVTGSGSASVQFFIETADNTTSYSGDGASGLYLFGAMLEESS